MLYGVLPWKGPAAGLKLFSSYLRNGGFLELEAGVVNNNQVSLVASNCLVELSDVF